MRKRVLDALMCPRTGHPLALDVLAEEDREGEPDVVFGVLTGPAGAYPVVCGIPVFTHVDPEVLALLTARRFAEATALAAVEQLPSRRRAQLLALGAGIRPIDRPADLLGRAERRRRRRAAEAALFPRGGLAPPLDVVRFGYLDTPGRSVDAFNYFRFRYSMPRHAVALSCIDADLPVPGPVLDVGCGAGHMTWALQDLGAPVVGVERELFLLLAARQLAPAADFVCADATSLPFADGWAARAFAFDVLSFVTPKAAFVREVDRVVAPGGRMVFTSVKNARTSHVYAGEPLPPEGWRSLVANRPHRLVPDRLVLSRYLAGEGLPAAHDASATEVEVAPTLTLLAHKGEDHFADGGPFPAWPHARGTLGVSPLYAPVAGDPSGVTYELRFPSTIYADDNPEMREYLPERFHIDEATRAAAAAGSVTQPLEPLLARMAVLGLPDCWPGDRWPSAHAQSPPDSALST